MPRIRTIKPEFWQHEELSALPEATHLLAAALLNYADDEGYFNANPKLVQASCFPLREPSVSVPESLLRLAEIGYIELGNGPDGRSYGRLVHFADHQRVSHPTPSKISVLEVSWKSRGSLPKNSGSLPNDSALKGKEGKGKEQGKESSSAQSRAGKKYVWEGDLISVTQPTLDRWRSDYPGVTDFIAELSACNDYYKTHPPKPGASVYWLASSWLKRAHDRAMEAKRAEDKIYKGVL